MNGYIYIYIYVYTYILSEDCFSHSCDAEENLLPCSFLNFHFHFSALCFLQASNPEVDLGELPAWNLVKVFFVTMRDRC